MTKRTYAITMPDGRIVTRKSSREYRLAIVGIRGFGDDPDLWRCIGLSGSEKAAEGTARTWRNYGWRTVQVIPVSVSP